MKRGWIIVMLSCLGTSLRSQELKGTITDSVSGRTLEEATVRIYSGTPPALKATLRNTSNGFRFQAGKADTILLLTTYTGYYPDTTILTAKLLNSFLRITLKPLPEQLRTVIIRSTIPPATVRADTIAFNPSAYPVRPRASLDELLRKLPGVEIDDEGNVTMQGQKVDKILVDGKAFFIRDLRSATRNLPADIIAQVEVFDTQSERDKLSGIKSQSTTKSINLKLKNE